METLILKIDTIANANILAAFLKTVRPVKSVVLEKNKLKSKAKPANVTPVVADKAEPYNWTNPTRPATEDEIEKMLHECEASPNLSAKEARELTLKEIKEWRKMK